VGAHRESARKGISNRISRHGWWRGGRREGQASLRAQPQVTKQDTSKTIKRESEGRSDKVAIKGRDTVA
jgi:hypothetical protein